MDIISLIYECSLSGLTQHGDKWNSRCPMCGDSKKSLNKKRFWILKNKFENYIVKCFNCGQSLSFKTFLKRYYPNVFKRFFKIIYKNKYVKKHHQIIPDTKDDTKPITIDINIRKVFKLPDDHLAHSFFIDRKIPEKWKKYMYYSDNFKKWINTKIKNKFEKINESDKRIVIPFYNRDRKIFGVAGRSLEKLNKPKYLTIMFDTNEPKIFGLERINFNKTIYVFEGQIDSLFIPNSIAMAGSISGLKKLTEFADIKQFVLVPDNEPRNREITIFIEKSLKIGFRVSLLSKSLKSFGKDINDLVINSKLSRKDIFDIINQNIVYGKKGLIKFKFWRDIK